MILEDNQEVRQQLATIHSEKHEIIQTRKGKIFFVFSTVKRVHQNLLFTPPFLYPLTPNFIPSLWY